MAFSPKFSLPARGSNKAAIRVFLDQAVGFIFDSFVDAQGNPGTYNNQGIQDYEDWITNSMPEAQLMTLWEAILDDTDNLNTLDEKQMRAWDMAVDTILIGFLVENSVVIKSDIDAYKTTQGGGGGASTGTVYDAPPGLVPTLQARGLIERIADWDPTTGVRKTVEGVSEETMNRILGGVKDWYSSQVDLNSNQYFDTAGWGWPDVLTTLRSANPATLAGIMEITYPQEAQNYYTIFADDGTGTLKAIPVPEASLTNMRQYSSKTLDTKQLHAAMVVGYANDVDWESILFVSDYLGGLDPVEYYGATVTDPFSGTVTPGMPTARPQINQDFVSIADRLKAGAGLYQGDEAFAILHATDPNLAGRVRNNPFKLTGEEVDRAKAILGDYSAFSAQPSSPPAAWSLQYINSLLPAGLEEPMTREEKPENVRKTYEDMYRQWFMETPTEAELDGFVAHFDRELDAYQRRVQGSVMNPFDTPELVQVGHGEMRHWEPALPGFEETQPTAAGQARSFLRSDDLYGPLYSKKPGGLTEEAYGQVMSGAAMTALGGAEGALAEGSIRAGMISGDTRSVARHAVYTGGAEQSSTLTGRLARAGDVFRRMT